MTAAPSPADSPADRPHRATADPEVEQALRRLRDGWPSERLAGFVESKLRLSPKRAAEVAEAAIERYRAETEARQTQAMAWLEEGASDRAVAKRLRAAHGTALVTSYRDVLSARVQLADAVNERRHMWERALTQAEATATEILAQDELDPRMRLEAAGLLGRLVATEMSHEQHLPGLHHHRRTDWPRGLGRLGLLAGAGAAVPAALAIGTGTGADLAMGLMGLVVPFMLVGFAVGRALGWALAGFRDDR
ncbi:hypothetical protein [Haliangium sp.]|uniref:hypothetical protein n=1 Tax=Haliangium sp. TaxID=2663208 RepID=UPI003D0EB2F0